MKMRMKRIPHPAIVCCGLFYYHGHGSSFTCTSLNINDFPIHRHRHRHQLLLQLQPVKRLQNLHRSQTIVTLRSSSKSNFDDDCDDEEVLNERSSLQSAESESSITHLQGQRQGNHIFSVLRTAITAFCSGALVALVFSMIFFSYSFTSNDHHIPLYQNTGAAVTKLISRPNEEQIKDKPTNSMEQKQKAVSLYRAILEQLNQDYADDIEPMELFETSTRAMLSTLDPYTEYVSPQDRMKRQQKLVGIGAFVMKAGKAPELLDGKSVSELMSLIPSAVTLPTQLLPSSRTSQDVHDMQSQKNNNGYRVVLSLENYAYDAGLRVGDEILEIDNQSVVVRDNDGSSSMITLERIREMLMGAPGTKVKLAVRRPGIDKVQTIDVERKLVSFPDVPYAGILRSDSSSNTVVSADSYDGIGYIKLRRFGLDAGISMQKAIQSIQSSSSGLKGLILDLRDNSGGELLSAVQIASLFVPEGTYLGSSEGKGSLYPNESYRSGTLDMTQYGYARSDNNNNNLKKRNDGISSSTGDDGIFNVRKQIVDPDKTSIVILVNKQTASASEFLAGVFQDLDKGVIIGTDDSTLGKGIGQREMGLPYGGALKLTYHEFYTPSGRCVQRQYQEEGLKNQIPQKKQKKQMGNIFYTENGRATIDRSGIGVDYKVEPKISLLSSILSSSGVYFEFATDFCSRHQWPSSDFFMDDSIYNDFKSFVLKEQRRGNLKLEEEFDDRQLLEKIRILSAESNMYDSSLIQNSVTNLQRRLVQDLLNDFDTCKDIIKYEIEQNILARQLPDGEMIRRSLKSDELAREAVRIIEDSNRYQELLGKSASDQQHRIHLATQ